MSAATKVPESQTPLTAHDAIEVLRDESWAFLSRSFTRLRSADGFSHARASAFAIALLLVEGTIAVLGLAVALGSSAFSRTIIAAAETAIPGPAGKLLTSAASQAQDAGSSHQYTALIVGLVAALITGTTAMGQFERSCNRIYGIDQDRPSVAKYTRAFGLAVSAGAASAMAIVVMVLGRPVAESMKHSDLSVLWVWGRWPLALIVLVVATTAILKFSPNRVQPSWSSLALGAAVSVLLMVAASLALGVFFRWSSTFGDTYGPLAGMIGLLLWCYALAAAGLFGIAMTAQMEDELGAGGELTTDTSASMLTR